MTSCNTNFMILVSIRLRAKIFRLRCLWIIKLSIRFRCFCNMTFRFDSVPTFFFLSEKSNSIRFRCFLAKNFDSMSINRIESNLSTVSIIDTSLVRLGCSSEHQWRILSHDVNLTRYVDVFINCTCWFSIFFVYRVHWLCNR